MYEWHHYHMIDELRRDGHEVAYCNPVEKLGRFGTAGEYSDVVWTVARDMVRHGGCDLFFATATDETLLPEAVREIRRLGIPAVNLSTDDMSVPFRVRKIGSSFDLLWTSVRDVNGLLRSYGAKTIVMPWAANPHVFRPGAGPELPVIGFIGGGRLV